MKKVLFLSVFLIYSLMHSQIPSGCDSPRWPSSVSTDVSSTFNGAPGSGFGWTYKWVVSGDLQIVSADNDVNAEIQGNAASGTGTVYFTRYKDGVMACTDKKEINITGPSVTCGASIHSYSCTVDNDPNGNTLLNAVAKVQNPFPNEANVTFQVDPAFHQGVYYIVPPNPPLAFDIQPGTTIHQASLQFRLDLPPTSGGFTVHFKVEYTDKTTLIKCTVDLQIFYPGCSCPFVCPGNKDAETVSCAPASIISSGGIEWYITFEVSNPFCNPATIQTIESYSSDPQTEFYDTSPNQNFGLPVTLGVGATANISRQYEIGGSYGTSPNNYTGNISVLYIDTVTNEYCTSFIYVESYCSPSGGGGGGDPDPRRSIDNNENENSNYIFPNPVKKGEALNLMNLDKNKVIDIKVFDIQGNEIKNTNLIDDKLFLNSNSKGIHFVKIYTVEGTITEKLIID